jgi:hypothetical protein
MRAGVVERLWPARCAGLCFFFVLSLLVVVVAGFAQTWKATVARRIANASEM